MQLFAVNFISLQGHYIRVLSTPIIRGTKTVCTASVTGHTVRYKDILSIRIII